MYKYIWTAIVSYTDQWFTGQNGLRGLWQWQLVVINLGGELGAHNESKWSQCYVHYSSEKNFENLQCVSPLLAVQRLAGNYQGRFSVWRSTFLKLRNLGDDSFSSRRFNDSLEFRHPSLNNCFARIVLYISNCSSFSAEIFRLNLTRHCLQQSDWIICFF